jgi:hypothetical protein
MAAPTFAGAPTASRTLGQTTFSAEISSDGGETITDVFFNYGRSSGDLSLSSAGNPADDPFTVELALTPGTWYFQAGATNADGTTLTSVVSIQVYGEAVDVRADESVAAIIASQETAGYYFVGTGVSAKASNILLLFSETPGASADARMMGSTGRWRVNGGQTAMGNIYAVLATTDNFAYGPGCVALIGQAPAEDDAILEGATDLWPATTVVAKSGKCWVYGFGVTVS